MRKVTLEDAARAKLLAKSGDLLMVYLPDPLAGKRMVPLLDVEIINGQQYHIVDDSSLKTRLHYTYQVWMLEEGDEIPAAPAKIVALRPSDRTPKSEDKPIKKEKVQPTETERQYGNKKECICGCGSPTGSVFAPGHDARMKSLLGKVQKGEATLADVPELVLEHVRNNAKWNGWYGNVLA